MYLTAHRIISREGKVGINAFLHKHSDIEVPNISWEEPDIDLIADLFPGSLVAESIDIAPGNNQVLSYLDVVTADSTEITKVVNALEKIESEVETQKPPLVEMVEGVGIRFALQFGRYDIKLQEYRELKNRSLNLLKNPVPPPWQTGLPLIVDVSINDQGLAFSLDADSTKRVRDKHGGAWASSRVIVGYETKHEFERIHGDVIRHIIPVLTGLSLEQVAAMGGVRLRDMSIGQEWEWPKRK